jgi:hypothetical protein
MASNRPTTQPYDEIDRAEDFRPHQHVAVNGICGTLLGTVATAATLLDLFVVPANSNIKVSGASMKITTGGTRAGTAEPTWGLAYSLAGTGANTVFGSMLFGTRADNTYGNFSVTSTNVSAGDVIRLTSIAGTDSDGSEIGGFISVEYRENWD